MICTAAASIAGFSIGMLGGFATGFIAFVAWALWRLFR
jgi:hypothetical protein